ncbi:MAG: sigma factor, partial [Candidatus Uhrbacteria bacterium]|nr:sigma factor [Candidatus Uhrbacteria bacterium]
EQLVINYRKGDRNAFDQLVARYAHPIYHFIYGYVRDVGQAEDSTQDTFVKIWKYLHLRCFVIVMEGII